MPDGHDARCLLILRVNNHAVIKAAFGPAAAHGAMEHLARCARRLLGRVEVRAMEDGELALSAFYPAMRCAPLSEMVEDLCAALGRDPFPHADGAILLSLSAGFGHDRDEGSMGDARMTLSAAPAGQGAPTGGGEEWARRYRKDMRIAASLVQAMARGATFWTWRPVCRAGDHDHLLHHEAAMRRVNRRGEQGDCAEGRAALDRLGLRPAADRMMFEDMLDELAVDPSARLSVALSTQSLSQNLYGERCGWNRMIERLRRDRGAAERLIIEIDDHSPILRFGDLLGFVRVLRTYGVRFAVGRFGSGRASLGQLMLLAPDMVKLDSCFLHTAYRSPGNRRRVAKLIDLAASVGSDMIIDGVETPWHMRVAAEEGAQWIAGAYVGNPARRRGRPTTGASMPSPTPTTQAVRAALSASCR